MDTHTKLPLFHFILIAVGFVLIVSGLLASQLFAAGAGNRKIVLSSQQFAVVTDGNMISVGKSSGGKQLALANCYSSANGQGGFAINCPTSTSGPQVAGEQDIPPKQAPAITSSFSVIVQIITALMHAAGF